MEDANDIDGDDAVPVFKVLVVGDINTGKTALAQRFVNNHFSTEQASPVGEITLQRTVDYVH